jgi:hemerythrin
MIWSDTYKIGLPAVDSQHKRLFQLVQELNEALDAGLRLVNVKRLLTGLDQYKTRHFQLEEKYMLESNYPGLDEQQKAHKYFSQRFKELGEELERTGITPEIIKTIKIELGEWLQGHVTSLDLEFGKYYQQQESQK